MGINLGVALGAAAQSGMNTYLKLGEEQRQEEELRLRKQEAAYQEELRQQERELNKITALTLGSGDKRTVADQSTVNQSYEGADAPAATGYKEVAYSPQQQMADFKQRALSAGIPIQKVTAVSGAHRAEKYAEREEMALGFTQQVMDDVKANPTDLGAVFKKHFQEQYNEGKLPGLGDGKTADVVPAATGGQSIVLKDAKGNVTKTIPLDINTIQAMTQKWTGAMMSSSSPASWWKSREADLKEREVAAKEGELGVHKEFYGKGGTYERAAGMRAGAGGDKSIKAKASEYAEALVDAGTINPATKKPYTTQEAKQYALGVTLKDPNTKAKAEWTMSQAGDFRSNAAGVVQDFDPKTNQWKTRGLPQVSANANKVGVIADVSPSGQVGFKGKDGWYSTEQEAVESLSAPSSNAAQPTATALPTGSRAELRSSADKIDAEIAALRKSVTVKTPSDQRVAIGKEIDALQAQRSATLKAWAKTPGVVNDSGAAYPVPRP